MTGQAPARQGASGSSPGPSPWADAVLAAAALAVDPAGLGGVVLRSPPSPLRDNWLDLLRQGQPPDAPWRRVPLHVTDGRLFGGLDLAATLRAGKPLAERGLLAECDGGMLILASAERLSAATAARLTATVDRGMVAVERDGTTARHSARFGIVALDESLDDSEAVPPALADRLALHIDLNGLRRGESPETVFTPEEIAQARKRLRTVTAAESDVELLCGVALALGTGSLRAEALALRFARVHAALHGRTTLAKADCEAAARLVLAPRASRLPLPDDEPPAAEEHQAETPPEDGEGDDRGSDSPPEDLVLAAAQAAIPPRLLAQLQSAVGRPRGRSAAGRVGALQLARRRGRPVGTRRGDLAGGNRLNLVETLRTAAPWQPLRRRRQDGADAGPRMEVRRDDFRIVRFKQRSESVTIFVVDASGSAALHRLAEAKGAVELLLTDCYARRDQVALIAFRGAGAEVLLPPTRSLVRAKRELAALPGGGGTPLADGLDAALALAEAAKRQGRTPSLVLLTDGRANVSRDGSGGRAQAEEDAQRAARRIRGAGLAALFIDTGPRANPFARDLAAEMGARYLALPRADARSLSAAVQDAGQSAGAPEAVA
ncbi:magnesium chelatase subunit D [Pelagibius sp.]|uniref:magnesium chelatase subunit D n=1 Tax=Pelagibius sp. TaxID=1931238 RepID=UPI0026391685|nr:magnesium chelatase subunit D [Pelagibius sp.]